MNYKASMAAPASTTTKPLTEDESSGGIRLIHKGVIPIPCIREADGGGHHLHTVLFLPGVPTVRKAQRRPAKATEDKMVGVI